MKNPAITITLVFAGALAGCASAVPVVDFYDSDSDTLRRFQTITVLDGASASARELIKLGAIEGIYCNKSYKQDIIDHHFAEAQALDQVKLKAAELGANYITTPQCVSRDSGDFANNCRSTVICTSSALKGSD